MIIDGIPVTGPYISFYFYQKDIIGITMISARLIAIAKIQPQVHAAKPRPSPAIPAVPAMPVPALEEGKAWWRWIDWFFEDGGLER